MMGITVKEGIVAILHSGSDLILGVHIYYPCLYLSGVSTILALHFGITTVCAFQKTFLYKSYCCTLESEYGNTPESKLSFHRLKNYELESEHLNSP